MPSFTLREIILLIDPTFTKRIPLVIREINKRIQEIKVIKNKVSLKKLINLKLINLKDLLPKIDYI